MITKQKRPYEMSIWTLQDSYIATLKAIGENGKNQIQEPKIDLNIDGTQTLSFTIPMYYYNEEGIKVENPKWYNTINGNLIASLRKIKVIINKQRAQEKVIEFIITKVTERHEKAELYCDVECEGLAFHELGKTGYKITLSSEDFYAADLKWFQEDGQLNKQPHATIDWWCDQFLTPYPTNGEAIDPLTWYYKVDMDWSGYSEFNGSGLVARDSSKIYEEEYISSWDFKTKTIDMGNNQSITINEKVVPSAEEAYKEKERIVDFSESNKYNLTQSLAEAFGVFCKYEYTYDDAYHITGRTVIFYNSFLKEDPIDITYKYDTSSISRNMDGTDIVTKMYVRPVDSDINDSGWITILDVDANKSKEDYILNFDYLYSIGAIDDDAYGEIENYEMQMREKNIALIPIQEKLTALNIELPEAQAQQTLAANAIQLDKERLTAADDLINNLTNNTGIIEVTNENPDTAVLLQRNGDASDIYYIKITKPGVDPNSIKIYKAIDFSAVTVADRLKTDDLITSGKFEYDEFMNLIEISNLKVENITSKIVYLTYNYTPELQYERVKKTWEARLLKDTEDKSLADAKVARLEQAITDQEAAQETLLKEKKIIMNKFERLMGAAIREGFWQPDSYNDYGDKYIESVNVELTTSNISDDMVQFEWSNKEFEGEQKLYYEIGADTQKKYYPCIRLTDDNYNVIRNIVRATSTGWERLDTLSYLYYDTSISEQRIPRNYKCMSLGSEMTLAFVKKKTDTEIIPILLLIGAEKLSDNIINTYLSNGILGTLTVGSNHVVNVNKYLPINGDVEQGIDPVPIKWLTLDDSYEIVYPRIAINSTELKTSEDQLSVKYSGENLTNFEDYYILIDSENKKNYITLKPKTLIKYVNFPNTAQIKFTLSNAALEIYLDAIEVEKESAFPRVSYDLKVDMVREEFVTYLYNLLNRVANINDWELHFENVQGYISKVSLNLDQPWEDSLEIQNYKTKFEDLFAKIVASTEQMQKNQYTVNVASQAFDSFGNLQDDAATVKLPIELNKGKLIIDKEQGIVSANDSGMVAFRGDGIFTASEQDENGNWIWHSAVLPQGINADSITTGQLDTNLINIYSGDNLKFQLKDDGLFAYKTISTDDNLMNANSTVKADLNANYKSNTDYKQYVVHNEDGLFLHTEPGAKVAKNNGDLITISNSVDRVEISWDGLVLRNWANQITLFANADTGNLFLSGVLDAENIRVQKNHDNWLNGQNGDTFYDFLNAQIDDHVKVSETLQSVINDIGTILETAISTLTSLDNITIENRTFLSDFIDIAENFYPTIFTSATRPSSFKPGDIWNPASGTYAGNKYIAMSYSSNSSSTTVQPLGGWNKVTDGSIASITGAGMNIDAAAGTIDLYAGSKMVLRAKSELELLSGDIQITGNNCINIGSNLVNIAATSGINIINTHIPIVSATAPLYDEVDIDDVWQDTSGAPSNIVYKKVTAKSNDVITWTTINAPISKVVINDNDGIKMTSSRISFITAGNNTSVLQLDDTNGIHIGSNKEIRLFSSAGISGDGNVLINPDRILFGVSNVNNNINNTEVAVELTKDYLILAAGNKINDLRTSNPSNSVSGLKMTKDSIILSTETQNIHNLISMDSNGITLGTVGNGNAGSFIQLNENLLKIGSSSNIYIDAANIGLDSAANDAQAVAFRLGDRNNPTLQFINGSLSLTGVLSASTGSTIAGWNTTSNAFYRGSNLFENSNGLYFGHEGLSLGDQLAAHLNYNNQTYSFDYLKIGKFQENNETRYLLQMIKEGDQYKLTLDSVELAGSAIDTIQDTVQSILINNGAFYRTSSITSNIPDFDNDAIDGSLGVLFNIANSNSTATITGPDPDQVYMPGKNSPYIISNETGTTIGYAFKDIINDKQNKDILYNSVLSTRSYSLSNVLDDRTDFKFKSSVRVGRPGGTDYKSGALHKQFSTDQIISTGTSLQINFGYCTWIYKTSGNGDEEMSAGTSRNNCYIYLYKRTSSTASEVTLIGEAYFSTRKANSSQTITSITKNITISQQINASDYIDCIIYSDQINSLIHIDLTSVTCSISQTTSSLLQPSLWLKDKGTWKLLASVAP